MTTQKVAMFLIRKAISDIESRFKAENDETTDETMTEQSEESEREESEMDRVKGTNDDKRQNQEIKRSTVDK